MASGPRSGEGTGILATAIAIDKDKNSQHAVKWAVENLLKRNSQVVLVHVKTQQSSQPQDVVPEEGRAPTQSELQHLFLPYRGFCARKGIRAKEVVLHDADVTNALVGFVKNNSISTIVAGASSRNALTRAFRNLDVPTNLGRSVPDFCSVYAIAKGKVHNVRSASRPPMSTSSTSCEDLTRTYSQGNETERISFDGSSDFMWTPISERVPRINDLMHTPPRDRFPASKIPSHSLPNPNHRVHPKGSPPNNGGYSSDSSGFSGPPSFQSSEMSFENMDPAMTSDASRSLANSQSSVDLEDEMRRLRLELKQTMEMYNSACREALNAKQKAREIDKWKSVETRKFEEAKQGQEAALAMVEMEKQKSKAAIEAAQMAQRLAELETQKRKLAEHKAQQESEEKKKAMDALARSDIRYRRYSIEEIEIATDYFAISAKIGEGGYGPVFKASLDHTAVAIKVLRPDISQGLKQFQQEVEVLSCMRHPNMVLLLGACPEYGCLVYEYMENGSLEDRLFRRNNTPTMPWRIRFKIAAEIATALLFLHQAKPEPLVHRDLKPANILLNQDYVSKISDVGLARLVPPSVADSVTQYHMTAAAGTFCYIDPEYQQTGMLSTKSDIYSLGIMLLQIITAKPPMGLTHHVSRAIEKETFSEILDQTVKDWPLEEAMSFAKMALQCCELRKKDRPDLRSVLLPELNRLREFGLEHGGRGRGRGRGMYGGSPPGSSYEVSSSLSQEVSSSNSTTIYESENGSNNSNATLGNLLEE